MKRLQVGDECYVRNGRKDLFKAQVKRINRRSMTVFIPHMRCTQDLQKGVSAEVNSSVLWNLVYPFPCIKELAK